MSFLWPSMLILLVVVPVLVWGYVRIVRRRSALMEQLGSMGVVQARSGKTLGRRRHVPFAIFLGAITLLLVSLARPQMVLALPRLQGTVVLAFDVSSSMVADDLAPTRLEAAKAAARDFVEQQPPSIEIGVVAFSNGAFITQPPTGEQADVLAAIDRLEPSGGTSIGQGIFTSLQAIAGKPLALDPAQIANGTSTDIGYYSNAVIVLLTDGENTDNPDPTEVAQVAADAGVRIFPVGIGSASGTVVEIDGFSVATALDEALLTDIASLTGGAYFHAESEADLGPIYDHVDKQLTVVGEKTEVTAIVAALSAVLLVVGGALSMLWFGRAP